MHCATGPDAIRAYWTGAATHAAAQASAALSLGTYRSANQVPGLAHLVTQPLTGITIEHVAYRNGPGTGTLAAVGPATLAYTPPGGSVGANVTIEPGGRRIIAGASAEQFVRVYRSATSGDLEGSATFLALDAMAALFPHVPSSAALAGQDTALCIALVNVSPVAVVNVAAWLGATSEPLSLATEAPTAQPSGFVTDGRDGTVPGLSWSVSPTAAAPLTVVASLASGEYQGLWLRRTLAAGAAAAASLLHRVHWSYATN